jgi:hypothetical protein
VVVEAAVAGDLMHASREHQNRLSRLWAYSFSIAVVIAVLSPVLGDPRADSFPLSTYPMFSGRQSRIVDITHVVGFTPSGERAILAPEALGTDEVVQAFETSRQAAAAGQHESQALCEEAADWGAKHRSEAISYALVTDRFDALAYFEGNETPASTTIHSQCGRPE